MHKFCVHSQKSRRISRKCAIHKNLIDPGIKNTGWVVVVKTTRGYQLVSDSKGETQQEIADALGIGLAMVNRAMNSETMKYVTLSVTFVTSQ